MCIVQGHWLQYCPIGEKMQKIDALHKTFIPWNLLKEKIQNRIMWKRTSWAFQKSIIHGVGELYTGSYSSSKMEESEKTVPSTKIRCAKKRHAFNNAFLGLKQIAGPLNHVCWPCYSFQVRKCIIGRVSFLRLLPMKFILEFWPDFESSDAPCHTYSES